MEPKGVEKRQINKFEANLTRGSTDLVVVEAPLEIRLGRTEQGAMVENAVTVTMRTPGNDNLLALGFLFSEGIIKSKEEVASIAFPERLDAFMSGNLIQINLREGVEVRLKTLKRNFQSTSSCGVCGKESIEAIAAMASFNRRVSSEFIISSDMLRVLPDKLFQQQNLFKQTGGIHAAAFFDSSGNLLDVQEDVGRHNALDKLIGNALLLHQMPLDKKLLFLSGRIGFELVQKAAMAKIPFIAAVGAPTTLAIDIAAENGITLVGFLKQDKFNIYTGEARIL